MNERSSIHEKFRVNGTRSWDNRLHWKTGNRVANDVIWRSTPFIQPPGINWVTGAQATPPNLFAERDPRL